MITSTKEIVDNRPVIEKLRVDLRTCTSDVRGVDLPEIIVEVLRRANELAEIAVERGVDLTAVPQIAELLGVA
jgi:hypothetical protein